MIKKKRTLTIVLAAAVFASASVFPYRYYDIPGSVVSETACFFDFKSGMVSYADEKGTVNTSQLNVRSGPSVSESLIATLPQNTQVTITGETSGNDGYKWYTVNFSGKTGYVRSDYIKKSTVYPVQDQTFENYISSQGFPESYKNDLRGLHISYPNWVFKAFDTGLDWETVVAEECKVGRNLVERDAVSSWKSTETGAYNWATDSWPGFDGSAWVAASSDIIKHYLDPRNFLSDPSVFQFESHAYNSSVHTTDGLKRLVKDTFLEGTAIVPTEGSQIEGGEPVYDNTMLSSNMSGSQSLQPGSQSGSYVSSSTQSGSSSSSAYISSSGPSGSSGGSGSSGSDSDDAYSGPGALSSESNVLLPFAYAVNHLAGLIRSYAGTWEKDKNDASLWHYADDDGSLLSSCWKWIDSDNDGIAQCYYFDKDSVMAADTVIDGYIINSSGQWVDSAGNVKTKNVSSQASSAPGTAGTAGTEGALYKKVNYTDIIMKAAEISGVSPYVLASMIIQEQGTKGKSGLISGTNSSYPGYYNFFNIGAYAHDGMGAVEAGLKYASESGNGDRPWNSIEKSIIGGAKSYAANYLQNGQDTFYLKKFNVQGSNMYNHQYMTYTVAAAEEGAAISKAYSDTEKAGQLTFSIPVYSNMPSESCPLPCIDGSPNNKLSSLGVDGFMITPTFSMDTNDYTLIVAGSVSAVNITAVPINSEATVDGSGTKELCLGDNLITVSVKAGNGSVRDYRITITRKQDGSEGTASSVPGSQFINGEALISGDNPDSYMSGPGVSPAVSAETHSIVQNGSGEDAGGSSTNMNIFDGSSDTVIVEGGPA